MSKRIKCQKCKKKTEHSTHGFDGSNRRYRCLTCGNEVECEGNYF